jgi:hypothetical protein
MNVLILSNSAPNYHFFFNSLVKPLKSRGNKIIYAVDSEYSRLNNCVDQVSGDFHVFLDFFLNMKSMSHCYHNTVRIIEIFSKPPALPV